MTAAQEREIVRVCGEDYNRWDIPPAMRNRIETVEVQIPICQGRDNYAKAAEGNAERIANN